MSKRDAVQVRPRPNETADQAIRRFSRLWRQSGIQDELRTRERCVTQSERRRAKRIRAQFKRSREA